MDNKLPKVFHNKINKKLTNNNDYFYSAKDNEEVIAPSKSPKDIRKKINEIFSSPTYIYKANVVITLKDKKIEKRIIGRNKNYLITMDNETILIDNIINIEIQ